MTTFPNLQVGTTVAVMRLPTRQTAPFLVREMQEYKGLVAVYGETQRHGVVVAAGVRESPPRDGLFVYVPNGDAREIFAFGVAIGGRRTGLVFAQSLSLINAGQTAVSEQERYYPVISTPFPCWYGPPMQVYYVQGLPRPSPGQKDTLLELGRATIDLWLAWQAVTPRQLPAWAVLQRDIWKSRTN